MEIETLGDYRQFSHILGGAAGVGADEIGDDLLAQPLGTVDAVEDSLELAELLERRLAHEHQHAVAGVLGCHLQSPADMVLDEFASVFPGCAVGFFVVAAIKQQVIAHTAAYEALLDFGKCIHGAIYFEQTAVVGVEIRAYPGMNARGALAFTACLEVASVHAVHIG